MESSAYVRQFIMHTNLEQYDRSDEVEGKPSVQVPMMRDDQP